MVSSINKKVNKILVSFIDEAASEDVTGSCVYIETPNHKLLLDCGLHQSNNKLDDFIENNKKPVKYKPKDIDIVFISHLHGDHCLAVPKLYANGFRGATVIPNNSKEIFKVMATDSAYIAERDTLVINNQYNKKYKPIYDTSDVNTMLDHTIEKPIGEKIYIDDELSFMFIPSGHLLYGCQIILYITINGLTKTILYTGDIGNSKIDNKFVGRLDRVSTCDLLIGESTYGDRSDIKTGSKERENDLNKLKSVIDTQIKEMNGRVLIPSFAQSRIQQLALMVYELYRDSEWQPKVYIDSPLAISIFNEYEQVLTGEEKEQFVKLLKWDKLIFVKESEDSKTLVSSDEPCLILSTAGMCQVGRVRHHLKSLVSNPNATILFVGFSTEGSLASILKNNKVKTINIDQKEYKCKCSSYRLKSMSGHAPFDQLVDYYSSVNCNKIILHHGSKSAKEKLSEALKYKLENECKSTRVVISNSSLYFTL